MKVYALEEDLADVRLHFATPPGRFEGLECLSVWVLGLILGGFHSEDRIEGFLRFCALCVAGR